MKFFKFTLVFTALMFSATASWAYIPKLSTILSKMASNSGGNKAMIIKRTVTLKEENLSWMETWYISHADAMKVDVEGNFPDGKKWAFEVLYKNGKRTTGTTEGKPKTFPLSPEFFEPLLHVRSSKALTGKLTAMQILPTWAASRADADASGESYINLDRFKGGVVYILGSNETKNTQLPPRLWVEQDSFVPRKVRLGSQVEVEFENVKDFEEGKIKQPETQNIFWKNATVLIQNTSVQMVEQNKVESALKLQKGETEQLPDNVNIKEFYSRFR